MQEKNALNCAGTGTDSFTLFKSAKPLNSQLLQERKLVLLLNILNPAKGSVFSRQFKSPGAIDKYLIYPNEKEERKALWGTSELT